MADILDELIEWLVDEVVYSGDDGISVSQLLARVAAFYSDADKPMRTLTSQGHESSDESRPVIDDKFKEQLWKSLTVHHDILVGERGNKNHLTLSELQAFRHATPTQQALPAADELSSRNRGGAAAKDYESDPSSPSAQLLEQIQSPSTDDSATRKGQIGRDVTRSSIKDPKAIDGSNGGSPAGRDETDLMAFRESHTPDANSPNDDVGLPAVQGAIPPHIDAVALQPRIYTSMARKWMTIVGRKPDFRKISKLHWRLLYAIGQARGNGMSQQQLLHATSQDENTVSLQLINLVQKGYLVRKQVIPNGGLGSTLFILKKFSNGMTTPRPEPIIHRDMIIAGASQPLIEDDGIAVGAISTADGIGGNGLLKSQTPHHNGRLLGGAGSLSGLHPRKEKRGRPRTSWATHTTYDECQIADGVPGIYRDIAQFNHVKPSAGGRPKKKLKLLFKSENLKEHPWFHKQPEENTGIKSNRQEAAFVESADPQNGLDGEKSGIYSSSKRSRGVDTDESNTSPPLKRAVTGRRTEPSYQVPTQSARPWLLLTLNSSQTLPGTLSLIPRSALSIITTPGKPYVSPYAPVAPPVTPDDRLAAKTNPADSSVEVRTPKAPSIDLGAATITSQASTVTKFSHMEQTPEASCARTIQYFLRKKQPQAQTAEQQLPANDDTAVQNEPPLYFSKLSTNKDGINGSLWLSADRKSLTFLADSEQPDSPKVRIQISEISDPPQNVAIDSNAMELRISTIDENETETLHSFPYLSSNAEDGNIMRANIVTAITILEFENDQESPVQVEKPFKCDQCGGSWKNWEGIKYHQTRSQTACNPQFTQSKKTEKRGRPLTKRRARRVAVDVSEGGIAADEELVENKVPTLKRLTSYSTKLTQVDPKARSNVTKATKLESPHQRSKGVITALLNAHHKMFPGEYSLWRAYEATWLQTHLESNLPDRNQLEATLNLLVNSGDVRSMQFSFKDEMGLMRMRTIVMEKGVDLDSTEISELKELMKAAFPEHYHPPLTELSKVVQSDLEAREHQQITKVPQKQRQTRSGRVIKEVQRLSSLEFELEDELNLLLGPVTSQEIPQAPAMNEASSSGVGNEERSERSTSYVYTPAEETDSDFVQPRKRRKLQDQPLSVIAQEQPWQPAVDFLQNEDGAWSNLTRPQQKIPLQVENEPIHVKNSLAERKPYRGRTHLPEPVTYMQTLESSAWAFRPYGHGVRPIHARPSTRVSNRVHYLDRIERGFRPVLMPRNYIGSTLPETGSVEGPYHKRTRSSSPVGENHDETSAPLKKRRGRPPKRSTLMPAPPTLLPVPGSFGASNFASPSSRYFAISQQSSTPGATSYLSPYRRIPPPSPRLNNSPNILSSEISQSTERENAGYDLASKKDSWSDGNSLSLGALRSGELRETPAWQKPRRNAARITFASRRLTALPGDLGDMVASVAAYPDMTVEVAVEHHQNINARKRNFHNVTISKEMEHRLKIAVVAIRTLTGGLDKQIDWVLVSKMFPQLSLNTLRGVIWPAIAAQHKMSLERFGRAFEDFFIKAYKEGEVSPINYDHLLDYDWERLVDLISDRVKFEAPETAPRLPANRSELESSYESKVEEQRPWRDDFFNPQAPVYKRVEKSSSEQATLPLKSKAQPQQVVDDLTIARSWARANTITPQNNFDPRLAQAKLSTLPEGVLRTATNELIAQKVIAHRNRGRPVPGRGFELSDTFSTSFRKHLDEKHLSDAYAFKTSLDRAFLLGEKVPLEWAATDGDILAMTNLQAHGRINLIPCDNVPMSRFGLTGPGNYQTKKMAKSKLRFDLEIRPTSSYVYTPQLPILSKSPFCLSCPNPIEATKPPHGPNGAIPLWYDIGGHLIKGWWKKALCTILGTVAMRPGIGTKEVARLFAPALEEWEIRILIEWGCAVGALVDVREDGNGIEWRDGSGKGEHREADGEGKAKDREDGRDAYIKEKKLQGAEGWSTAEWWWIIGGRDL